MLDVTGAVKHAPVTASSAFPVPAAQNRNPVTRVWS